MLKFVKPTGREITTGIPVNIRNKRKYGRARIYALPFFFISRIV